MELEQVQRQKNMQLLQEPRHIKAECHALKEKKKKSSRAKYKSNYIEEINYCCETSMSKVTMEDMNILTIESTIEAQVHLTTEGVTN